MPMTHTTIIYFTIYILNRVMLQVNYITHKLRNVYKEYKRICPLISGILHRLSMVEQQFAAYNLEVIGVPEIMNEYLPDVILRIAFIVRFPLTYYDIHACTRITHYNNDSRPRPIFVKFYIPIIRDGFLRAIQIFNEEAINDQEKLNTILLGFFGDVKPVYVCKHLYPVIKCRMLKG